MRNFETPHNDRITLRTKVVDAIENQDQSNTMCINLFVDNTDLRMEEEQIAQDKYNKLMLAGVTHELKTPMNAISAYIDIMLASNPRPEDRQRLKIMRSSKELMLSLIDDILDAAKLSEGKFNILNQEFTLSSLLHEVKDIFVYQIELKGLHFSVSVQHPAGI